MLADLAVPLPAPPRVVDIELYWTDAPPELSPRCTWWLKRITLGWRPNKRVNRLGYYARAAYFGVYIWELIERIEPALKAQAAEVVKRAGG